MPRIPWPGLPDAAGSGTSISSGAVRSRFRPVVDKAGAAARRIKVV